MNAIGLWFPSPVRYADGVRMQEALVAARQADRIPDTVLFLEHAPVITLGRRGRKNFLLATPEQLQQHGVDLVHSSRGGDVTYHGPGQLVMYPVIKLGTAEADAHGYLKNLEEIAIRTAAAFGITARRRPGMNGAWTDAGKIAAIGFHLKRWVTMHGMSFNVNLDLRGFSLIVGCGLVGERVSSLAEQLGERCPNLPAVRDVMARCFGEVCQRPLAMHTFGQDCPEVVQKAVADSGFPL
ncbi:MAG TPA: lipoyl(octanoyl) transferase LipB [Kiritimatiellia bacterium]|nr:lipoyl(octanoyl) transferase LipB [Kiritimatiellia bacterium]